MSTLEISHVDMSFGGAPILRDVSLTVPDGTRTALVGASGSGKSTLLRLIAGFETPESGTITVGSRPVAGPGTFVPAHRRGIAFVAQEGALFPHLTVEQNIRFGLPRGASRRLRIDEVADLVSLDRGLLERFPHELSGGQQQRVALARALAPSPGALLLDEPFSALDTGLRESTRAAVIDVLEASGVTTVLVTHDQEEALSFGSQVGVLEGGRLVQAGAPADVYSSPVDLATARFLGEAIVLRGHVDATRACVSTALGDLPVEHDRRTTSGVEASAVLLRPTQLSVSEPRDGLAAATVATLRAAGSMVTLDLDCGRGSQEPRETLRVEVTPFVARGLVPGQAVGVAVAGGVTAYDAVG